MNQIGKADFVEYDLKELKENIQSYDAFYCSVSIYLDKEFYAAAKKLRVIVTPSTGTDHINMDEAKKRDIEVISIKNDFDLLDNITSTAELALGLMISVARTIPCAFDSVKAGQWVSSDYRGHMLSGKTLGVIGYGRLGKMMVEYGKALRMKVLVADPYKQVSDMSIRKVPMNDLLKESDFISIHVHLNDETRGFIGKAQLQLMKQGAVIINTSRGAVIEEQSMLEELENGHLGGIGADVLAYELFENTSEIPLVQYSRTNKNVVITPHMGGVTIEAQEMAYERAGTKLKDWCKKQIK